MAAPRAAGLRGRGPAAAALVLLATLQTSLGVHLRLRGVVSSRIMAWFDTVESNIASVNYSAIPNCSGMDEPYTNVVVHIHNRTWSVVCGSMTGNRGLPLKDILDVVAPQLPSVDVYLPFGLHDGVRLTCQAACHPPPLVQQHVPVFAAAYHHRYSPLALPFAMGNIRASEAVGYMNTPVIGWGQYSKTWFTCNTSTPTIKKAVFRGKAQDHPGKYGGCSRACSWRDNGRLFVHSLGQEHPSIIDAAATNFDSFNVSELMPTRRKARAAAKIPFPQQLCNYQAVLNVGNNIDWAERLRSSFYGNAVVMVPENSGQEFFNSLMEPYVHYWPLKADLSDVVEQVQRVLALPNLTQQLQGQRDFADHFLSEQFMLRWNRVAIREYDRRVRMFKAGKWSAPSDAKRKQAKGLLKLSGCESYVMQPCQQ